MDTFRLPEWRRCSNIDMRPNDNNAYILISSIFAQCTTYQPNRLSFAAINFTEMPFIFISIERIKKKCVTKKIHSSHCSPNLYMCRRTLRDIESRRKSLQTKFENFTVIMRSAQPRQAIARYRYRCRVLSLGWEIVVAQTMWCCCWWCAFHEQMLWIVQPPMHAQIFHLLLRIAGILVDKEPHDI